MLTGPLQILTLEVSPSIKFPAAQFLKTRFVRNSMSGMNQSVFWARNACDQLDEAINATRHGLARTAPSHLRADRNSAWVKGPVDQPQPSPPGSK